MSRFVVLIYKDYSPFRFYVPYPCVDWVNFIAVLIQFSESFWCAASSSTQCTQISSFLKLISSRSRKTGSFTIDLQLPAFFAFLSHVTPWCGWREENFRWLPLCVRRVIFACRFDTLLTIFWCAVYVCSLRVLLKSEDSVTYLSACVVSVCCLSVSIRCVVYVCRFDVLFSCLLLHKCEVP